MPKIEFKIWFTCCCCCSSEASFSFFFLLTTHLSIHIYQTTTLVPHINYNFCEPFPWSVCGYIIHIYISNIYPNWGHGPYKYDFSGGLHIKCFVMNMFGKIFIMVKVFFSKFYFLWLLLHCQCLLGWRIFSVDPFKVYYVSIKEMMIKTTFQPTCRLFFIIIIMYNFDIVGLGMYIVLMLFWDFCYFSVLYPMCNVYGPMSDLFCILCICPIMHIQHIYDFKSIYYDLLLYENVKLI